MDRSRLEQLLKAIGGVRVAVIGDFCLDAYWMLDPAGSELSVETGKPTQTVARQRYGLGGAGNVVNNLVALGVGQVYAVGVVGDDLFGRELRTMLAALGVNSDGLCVQTTQWDTPVYGKPYVGDDELSRLDFGAFNQIAAETEQALLARLEAALRQVQAVIINQQLVGGINSDGLIAGLNRVIAGHPHRVFVVDSRQRSASFRGAILKVNDIEAGRLVGVPHEVGAVVRSDNVHDYARRLAERTGRPVFITRGARGMIGCDGGQVADVPGIQILTPTDPVGAGDAAVSALAGALAAGASVAEAAELANFAASVTVRKLKQCGTASPAEIVEIGADPDYVYRPELADDPRRARYVADTEIEIIAAGVPLGRIQHVVFDQDGTISTLRQGWEAIMEPMMVKAILGPRYQDADETLYRKAVDAVRDYIDKSTGIQTIEQMAVLVEMVRRFGCVPAEQVLDKFGYKAIYNDALMELVRARVAKFKRGELHVGDFTVKGAVGFLKLLHERGVKLYLASGTDREDVITEATTLGYADLFEGCVYGAVGDVSRYSKKMVVERILRENRLTGPELACIGDGPVELREAKKRGGIAVGVASDEVRRFGLNRDKRARLVRAGADVVVPDFSQSRALLDYLFNTRC
jgi:rfaE bifunctional protein kinase chain/domain